MYNSQAVIIFEHMEVRPVLLRDVAAFFDLVERNRPYLRMYFPKTTDAVKDLTSSEEFILQKIIQYDRREGYLLVIEINDQLIGMLSIKEIDWTVPKAEIAYFVDEKFQGKGIVSEAIKTLVSFSFDELGLKKIYARISPENPGSRRVVEKNGFKFEGVFRNDFRNGAGELIDVAYFALLRE